MTKLDWNQLVRERDEWVAHNFPNHTIPPPGESVLGIIEELGELAHAQLKELQAIRGTPEEHQANAKNAVGDIIVYLMGVMSHNNRMPGQVLPNLQRNQVHDPHEAIMWASHFIGRMARRTAENWPANLETDFIISWLEEYCKLRGWDFDQIVTDTWNEVKQRDWIANPVDGSC